MADPTQDQDALGRYFLADGRLRSLDDREVMARLQYQIDTDVHPSNTVVVRRHDAQAVIAQLATLQATHAETLRYLALLEQHAKSHKRDYDSLAKKLDQADVQLAQIDAVEQQARKDAEAHDRDAAIHRVRAADADNKHAETSRMAAAREETLARVHRWFADQLAAMRAGAK